MADAIWYKIYFLEKIMLHKKSHSIFRMGFFYKIQFGAVIFSNISEAFVRAVCSSANRRGSWHTKHSFGKTLGSFALVRDTRNKKPTPIKYLIQFS